MATVKKGAKIDFYKFVDPNKGASTTSRANARGGNKELTTVIKQNTRAINSMGRVVNSIGSTVVSMKEAQMKLLKIDEERLKKASFVPKYTKKKKMPKMKAFDSLFKGKIPGFFESLIKLASALIKFFLVLPALKWLSNPENQDKVVKGLEVLVKVFKFIASVAKFAFVNTIEGLYDLLKEDATWMERIGGFVKAMAGLGTAFLALTFLTNPMGIINTFKGVLLFFNKGLLAAFAKLATHPLIAGAALFLLPKYADRIPGLTNINEEQVSDGLDAAGDGLADSLSKEERIEQLRKEKEDLNFMDRLFGKGKEIEELIYYLETGKTKTYGFDSGGFLEGFAKGGWISGPQSGYPVSLDGNKPDFIGHGTEYVAQKSDGGAFIVPFDTPATKKNPSLTSQRMSEAKSLGFFAEGGGYDEFARKMIKIHEGFSPTAYPDRNGMSIGYGHLIKPTDDFPPTISRAYADKLFNEDYKDHKRAATKIPGYGKSSPQQKAGLIDLTYNQGPRWYKGFPLMMAAMQKSDYETAGDELKNSMWFNQVGRRGPTITNLIKNKGLEAGHYLLDAGLTVPMANLNSRKGFDWSFGLSRFFGGAPAAAATLDSMNLFSEDKRDGVEIENKTSSLKVIPVSSDDTGSGWGIEGVTDAHGRPLVFSEPAAKAFAEMMRVSNGLVKGSDVLSSGRSLSANKSVNGHKNSVHLYGEGLDISGSSATWMKNNASRFGWNYGYSHATGGGHYDFQGEGSGKTPLLGKPGAASFSYMDLKKENSGRGLVASSSLSGLKLFGNDQPGSGRPFTGMFSEGTFGDMGDMFTTNAYQSNPFRQQNKSMYAQNTSEQQKVRKVTEQRNQARREINAKTSEIVQMALAAVEAQNGSNRQFISTAESAIRNLLGAQQGGGTFASVGGTTGTVLRTAVAVLNSFNNPLRGIFR